MKHNPSFIAWFLREWKNAFAADDEFRPDAADEALLARVAHETVERRGGEAALILLESLRPLSNLGAQAAAAMRPFAAAVFDAPTFDRLVRILERRGAVDMLMEKIEVELKNRSGGRATLRNTSKQ